jgi:beta-glucosidase
MKLLALVACLSATAAADKGTGPPCPATTSFPWCDHTKPLADRVQLLVANLKSSEKAALFTNGVGAIDRISWPAYNWWSEALHGVARDGLATSFPQIGLVAASHNRTLWHQIGDVTSTEGRGKNNGIIDGKGPSGMYHGLTFWAPNVNIFRDPRWGRGE